MCLAHSMQYALELVGSTNQLCFPEGVNSNNSFKSIRRNNNQAVINLSLPGRLSKMCLFCLSHPFALFSCYQFTTQNSPDQL